MYLNIYNTDTHINTNTITLKINLKGSMQYIAQTINK